MADGLHSKRLSLDTNVLLNLAAKVRFAVDFKEEFQRREYALQVVPGVMAELAALTVKGNDQQRNLAPIALDNLLRWKITPITLTEIEKTYRNNFMAIVRDRAILPPKEINDARILADCGIAGIPLLVTSDATILDADPNALSFAFEDAGLNVVQAVNPANLVKHYKRAR